MRLTEQQINHFRTFGFLVFRQLFTPDEWKTYCQEFDLGLDALIPGHKHDGKDPVSGQPDGRQHSIRYLVER